MQNIYEFIPLPILLGVVNFVLQHSITLISEIPFSFNEYVFISLTLEKYGCNIELVIKLDTLSTSCEIVVRLMASEHDKANLTAICRQYQSFKQKKKKVI